MTWRDQLDAEATAACTPLTAVVAAAPALPARALLFRLCGAAWYPASGQSPLAAAMFVFAPRFEGVAPAYWLAFVGSGAGSGCASHFSMILRAWASSAQLGGPNAQGLPTR